MKVVANYDIHRDETGLADERPTQLYLTLVLEMVYEFCSSCTLGL